MPVTDFSHPDDQTVMGDFHVSHSPQRKEYTLTGQKRRTRGTVVLAIFPYRTNTQKLYLPTQAQAATVADILLAQVKSLNLVLKDGR